MICRGLGNYLTDALSKDCMDSAVRCGILVFTNKSDIDKDLISSYEANGLFVRCPIESPANNPKNATRDQMKPLVAGLNAIKNYKAIRRIFWSRLKSLCFAQNTERDKEGSTKLLYPHSFYKDSNPVSKTYPFWSKEKPQETSVYKVESKLFDCADPLIPSDMLFLAVAGKMWWLYPILAIGYPMHLLQVWIHGKSNSYEENQIIAECYIFGTLKFYKKHNPNWDKISFKYWDDRNELEYHEALIDLVLKA